MSATKEDSFQLEVHRINATSIKTFSASKLSKSESKQWEFLELQQSTPGDVNSFQFQIQSVQEGDVEEEQESQRDNKQSTFPSMSPIQTQGGVSSSMDISPSQQSFGFNMQRVATTAFNESSASKDEPVSEAGLSKLIEHMDGQQLGEEATKDLSFQGHQR